MWRAPRLSAAAAREGANEGAVAELAAAAERRLRALAAGVAAAADAAAARHGAVAADLAAHAGRAEADLASLQARSQRHGRPDSAWCVGGALAAALPQAALLAKPVQTACWHACEAPRQVLTVPPRSGVRGVKPAACKYPLHLKFPIGRA